jgi:drug/metabolite transporter (DMT)-like permease
MTWLLLAIISYFANAVNAVIDKFLLGKSIPSPIAYTFYVGILSIFVLVLVPFGLEWPGLIQTLVALSVGFVFLISLYAFYVALKENDASHVIPVIGGTTPVVVAILSYLFLGERLENNQLIAFFFLVLGSVLISIKLNNQGRYSAEGLKISFLAAVLLGIFYIMAKYVFSNQPFISGFIWTRLGSFLAALLLLISAGNRKIIFAHNKNLRFRSGGLFVFNKALAGGAFVLLNYAVFLGSATLINAIQGTQFAFLLILTVVISRYYPKVLEEKITRTTLIQKISAIIIIGTGLLMLSF